MATGDTGTISPGGREIFTGESLIPCRFRSGYHDIQQFTTFYLTKNPLQRSNGAILFASSRYLLTSRILGYFWDIKLKSVAVGKIPQNDHKNHSTPRFLTVNQNHLLSRWYAPRLQGDGTGSPTRALNGFASRNYFSSYR